MTLVYCYMYYCFFIEKEGIYFEATEYMLVIEMNKPSFIGLSYNVNGCIMKPKIDFQLILHSERLG